MTNDDINSRYKRALATIDNMQKRHANELTNAKDNVTRELFTIFIPVFDNVERLIQYIEDQSSYNLDSDIDKIETLTTTADAMYQELHKIRQQLKAKRIPTVGEVFDPSLHEAIGCKQSQDNVPSGTIIDECDIGWVVDGVVVKPAKVVVATDE